MTDQRRFLAALSYAGEHGKLVSAVAARLGGELGPDRVFYDRHYLDELARPNADLYLLDVFRNQSDVLVVFFGRDYERKTWCRLEWRAIRELIHGMDEDRVMLVRTDDGDLPGLLPGIDSYVDARVHSADEIAALVLKRVRKCAAPGAEARRVVSRPGLIRYVLDRWAPWLHDPLTRLRTLSEPPERAALGAYLRKVRADLRNEIRDKTYLPLHARDVARHPLADAVGDDPFRVPIRQVLRRVAGLDEGGDAASAPIAAVSRKSTPVHNILKEIRRADRPLVLLGEPGSGKTMTLQRAAIGLAEREVRRVFPTVPLYVRLGEFRVAEDVNEDDVFAFLQRAAPPEIRPWLGELDQAGRLVILFDGMDEMSRERYSEHTEALSKFADSRPDSVRIPLLVAERTRTLFSCRIADFSPAFLHRRLVLLPFDRSQIREYLDAYLGSPSITIRGESWTMGRLARHLAGGSLPIDASNPFVLWLLSFYLLANEDWPASRVTLLSFYLKETYRRKREERAAEAPAFPLFKDALREWARFAYVITERNAGPAIAVTDLYAADPAAEERVHQAVQAGKRCGVLAESTQKHAHLVRFEHHRFQEYFAALYIHSPRFHRVAPVIRWLDKLDAPRWQETMLNLLLLGGAQAAVRAFVDEVRPPIQSLRTQFEAFEAEKGRSEGGDPPFPSAKNLLKRCLEEAARILDEGGSPTEERHQEKAGANATRAPTIPLKLETVLADRVEHGARMFREGDPRLPQVRDVLKPCLEEAVHLLAERGNPLTQVKMMRACQQLSDIDVLRALCKPLRSPVRWVRDQALVLVSARQSAIATGADLGTEMGFDLANGSFLSRWWTYLKAVRGADDSRPQLCFALATLLGLLEFMLAAMGACVLYFVLQRFVTNPHWLGMDSGPGVAQVKQVSARTVSFLSQTHLVATFLLTVFGVAVGTQRWRFHGLWLMTPLSVLGLVVLATLGVALWYGAWVAIVLLVLPLALVGGALTIATMTWVGGAAHFGILGIYLWSCRRLRSRAHAVASFLASGWKAADFDMLGPIALINTLPFALFGLVALAGPPFSRLTIWVSALVGWPYQEIVTELQLLMALLTLAVVGWHLVKGPRRTAFGVLAAGAAGILLIHCGLHFVRWEVIDLGPVLLAIVAIFRRGLLWFLRALRLPYHPLVSELIAVTCLGVAVATVWRAILARHRREGRRALQLTIRAGALLVVIGPGAHLAIDPGAHLAGWMIRKLEPVFGWVLPLLASLSGVLGRVIPIVFMSAVAALYVWLLWRFWRSFGAWRMSVYPPRSFTSDRWKALIENGDPLLQQEMLLRTNAQSVGLRATGFQELLESVEPLVKQEPALSVYWDKRDQLAEAIRQERQG